MARTGDPTNTGTGGESIYWQDGSKHHRKKYFSAEPLPAIKHDRTGRVSMINNGQGKHGSQFFITLAGDLDYLDKQGHTVFGQVVEGLEVLARLNGTLVDDRDCPFKDLCLAHTVVIHDPYRDSIPAACYLTMYLIAATLRLSLLLYLVRQESYLAKVARQGRKV